MFVGFIGAVSTEIDEILKSLHDVHKEEHRGFTYHLGKRGKNQVVVTSAGVGKVNMAVAVTLLIELYHVDYLINSGTAGSIDTEIGTVCVASDVRYYDFYVPGFIHEGSPYQVPYHPYPYHPSTNLLDEAKRILSDKVKFGTIITGDRFVLSVGDLNGAPLENVVAIDMESAAVAQVAYLFSVDYLIIRTVSDNLNSKEYDQNEKQSSDRAAKIAIEFIDNYQK